MSKVIIAGSRRFPSLGIISPSSWKDDVKVYGLLCEVIAESKLKIDLVISGGAWGVDSLGERWAAENNVPVKLVPAMWSEYGKSAGPIRNAAMARMADALVCIFSPGSSGSLNMMKCMTELKKPVFSRQVDTN